jgi:HTH-type transcriptional repressor of NAD biosynthesis genes
LVSRGDKIIFVDSDAVITKYYLNMYFRGNSSRLVEEIVNLQDFDLVLYLEPDVDWVPDGIRFAGEKAIRQKNNFVLIKLFKEKGISYVSICGSYKDRLEKAKELVDLLFLGEKHV